MAPDILHGQRKVWHLLLSRQSGLHPLQMQDTSTSNATDHRLFAVTLHHITAMCAYEGWSQEELRWQDYQVRN